MKKANQIPSMALLLVIIMISTFTVLMVFVYKSSHAETMQITHNSMTQSADSQPQTVQANADYFTTNRPAPELVGLNKWLNPDDQPLTIAGLRGKVVLVDFWTFDCINCIHTLPYVTKWYDKYKDQGFVVLGIHSPEFAYEHETNNVKDAIKRYNIHYPVAQDNDFATWKAYNNQYWPAEYLIDKKGNIRREYFGEGEYDKTEEAIQALLKE
jgi:thiol-disulfide isomerase/thioredoxin